MITTNVDLGQLIIVGMMAIIGWFVQRTISEFSKRISSHEELLFDMNGDIHQIKGRLGIVDQKNHRSEEE